MIHTARRIVSQTASTLAGATFTRTGVAGLVAVADPIATEPDTTPVFANRKGRVATAVRRTISTGFSRTAEIVPTTSEALARLHTAEVSPGNLTAIRVLLAYTRLHTVVRTSR